jgi:hypothetical protein
MTAMAASTTRMSLEYLRALGYTVDVVERWTPSGAGGPQIKRDLFGILDLVAVRGHETVGVQTTSKTNAAARARKIVESEHIGALWAAGWHIVVHGWWQPGGKGHRYQLEEFDVVPKPVVVSDEPSLFDAPVDV